MKSENFIKSVEKLVSCVVKVEYVAQFDYYCVSVQGAVTLYELNRLCQLCSVFHVTSSLLSGCVDIICRLEN